MRIVRFLDDVSDKPDRSCDRVLKTRSPGTGTVRRESGPARSEQRVVDGSASGCWRFSTFPSGSGDDAVPAAHRSHRRWSVRVLRNWFRWAAIDSFHKEMS